MFTVVDAFVTLVAHDPSNGVRVPSPTTARSGDGGQGMSYRVQTLTTRYHLKDRAHGLHVAVWDQPRLLAVLVWRPGETIGCVSTTGYLALTGLSKLAVHQPVTGVLSLPFGKRIEHGVTHHVPSIVQGQQLNTV